MPALATGTPPGRPFHLLTKPIGPICNLDCKYCFYLEKESLYAGPRKWAMSDAVLTAYVRDYIASQPGPDVHFAWQGGEPTLLGVGFFERAVTLQREHAGGKTITNAIQTNGILLDDAWCRFLKANDFLVGLSIDGPRELHDVYRVDKDGRPTFDAVMRGLSRLLAHGVAFNTLTVVNRVNAERPSDVYQFLKQVGSRYLQFIPLVERRPDAVGLTINGLMFAAPPDITSPDAAPSRVTAESVGSEQYGRFLTTVFDKWVRRDVGEVFVQMFDVALGNWLGLGSALCVFAETCGAALAIEHNGDVYSCDHYVYPRYRLGNVRDDALGDMVRLPEQLRFGDAKRDTLPAYCRDCEVRFACNGECPKHRFLRTPDGEPGLNYLCAGYKQFFRHVDPYMRTMGELLQQGRAPAGIMDILRGEDAAEAEGRL